ncbi:uncharacterized protein LACBIDRAFT_332024 [Laccaria bicolor S238N-H82]|uniref:Predicted protein n=1 Tax=Laccaria bicolor (strain S238N-H82 / ATCC MYA-4686) TaxID=486041 RepID=B0DRB4_LACBS|nr:uncharacterized protein LACBIDRAFT_332024 [Laccaria bicolor S238N-H82]EDR02841.1 predicted protein [Laccaria bicolor S238N-H82]|eukprot:XP_001886551.1 predicted protein [Laccaria bicolor S238N-H82]
MSDNSDNNEPINERLKFLRLLEQKGEAGGHIQRMLGARIGLHRRGEAEVDEVVPRGKIEVVAGMELHRTRYLAWNEIVRRGKAEVAAVAGTAGFAVVGFAAQIVRIRMLAGAEIGSRKI